MGDLVLSCFFSELLENGVDTLVEELTKDSSDADLAELRKFWMSRKLSTKYKTLKRLVTDSLTWRQSEDGRIVRDKVFIISPSRRQGRTGDVLQRAINQEDGSVTNLYTSYELDTINDFKLMTLLKSWVSGLCSPEDIFLFKCMTEREGDLDDCLALAKLGLDWSIILTELKNQMNHSGNKIWVTWVGERLDLLQERGLNIPIMEEIDRLRIEYFEDFEKRRSEK
ncbi:hypothetical protein HYU21_00590 [Candidatus Woesearchaeota archaeon]|nr:hypothetical protein [Candidatus Woesearchaeota archaeon]